MGRGQEGLCCPPCQRGDGSGLCAVGPVNLPCLLGAGRLSGPVPILEWPQSPSLHAPPTAPGAAGQNKQHSITKNTAKLDRETEELHHDRVTLEVGKVIQQGRQSKGLTQKDLATVSGRRAGSAFRKHLRLRLFPPGDLGASACPRP